MASNDTTKQIKDKIEAARKQRSQHESVWAQCDAFYQGRQNVTPSLSLSNDRLVEYPSRQRVSGGVISRRVFNRIRPIVETSVAKSTSRTPGWTVDPDGGDPIDISQARLGQNALFAHYDGLGLAHKFVELLTLVINYGEGYVYPYWDKMLGAPIAEGEYSGEINVKVLHPQAVMWEVGLSFDESPWHAVELAFPASYVEAKWGIKNPSPDRLSRGSIIDNVVANGDGAANMVAVVEYLERPCHGQRGKRCIIIGDKVVEDGPYPYTDEETISKPWIVRFVKTVVPNRDRAKGTSEDLIDVQRSWNRTMNQIIEWKAHLANPGWTALKGTIPRGTEWNPAPGALKEYNDPEGRPEPDRVNEIPSSLFRFLDELNREFDRISAQYEVSRGEAPAGVEAASAIDALRVEADSAQGGFYKTLAASHAELGLRLLLLTRKHYTTERTLRFVGRNGLQAVKNFKGSDLGKRLNVRVSPGSIEYRSRKAVEARVLAYVDREMIPKRRAIEAIEHGTADNLLDDFELDIEWAQRENREMAEMNPRELSPALSEYANIQAGFKAAQLSAAQAGVEPPPPPPPVGPWPHAREFDNHGAHIETHNLFRKTEEFWILPPEVKEAYQIHVEEHESFVAQAEQRAYEAQQRMAMEQGEANAAKPARGRGTPSKPAPPLK